VAVIRVSGKWGMTNNSGVFCLKKRTDQSIAQVMNARKLPIKDDKSSKAP
jgi:hypothetical protein